MVKCFDSPFISYFVPELQLVVDMITRYLAVINSSINFIIYCLAGSQFRHKLLDIVKKISGKQIGLGLEEPSVTMNLSRKSRYFPSTLCT